MKTVAGFLLLLLVVLAGVASHAQEGAEISEEASEMGTEEAFDDDFMDFEDPFSEEEVRLADPLESFNRGMFWVNDKLYFYLLKPVARGYRLAPEPARRSVGNFFSNLAFPVRFVNSALQFKFRRAGNELRRFLLNSTVGFLGFLDPADQVGWYEAEEDLGQTLGVYGIGQGMYLVLPVFGPTTLRDGAGRIGDYFLDPLSYTLGEYELIGAKAYDRVNTLSLDNDTYEKVKEQALDPYLFIRNAYAQRRDALVRK